MSIGYPLGAVSGGIVAAQLLQGNDWRSVFYFGAAVTAVLIPITYFVVPESVHWLARKQPKGALEKINSAMARMGHPTVTALPTLTAETCAALGERHLWTWLDWRHGHRHARVLLPHHDVLLHPQMGAEDRRRLRLRGFVGRGRARVDERRRSDRRRRARAPHAEVRGEGADDCRDGAFDRDGGPLRQDAGQPADSCR